MDISPTAYNMIIAAEVTDQQTYERKYRGATWPGSESGVTIAIGYDIGHCTGAQVRSDWRGRIPDGVIANLERACGITGIPAKKLASQLNPFVDIPWNVAEKHFREVTIPRWEAKVRVALPNTHKLPSDSFGALVSLAFNRGASFSKEGDRYREMRAIRAHMMAENFWAIPDEIRSMTRLWDETSGLHSRRLREADLFERGLDDEEMGRAPPPPDIEPPDPDKPTLPPATPREHWTVWGSFGAIVAGITAALDGHPWLVGGVAAIVIGLAWWLRPRTGD